MVGFKYCCFTINNPTRDEVEIVTQLLKDECTYIICQLESGGTTGTRHMQGYCIGLALKRFETWQRLLGGRAHLEKARGNPLQNRAYCTKEESRVPGTEVYEHGTCPTQGQGSRTDIRAAFKDAPTLRLGEFIDKYPDEFARYNRAIGVVRLLKAPKRTEKSDVIWLYGPTGTGKTKLVYDICPGTEIYLKDSDHKWYDGYDYEHSVVIDEYRPDFCKFKQLLKLFDRYPYSVEVKGGIAQFNSKRIFLTSPAHPFTYWTNRTGEDLGQLGRRLGHVIEFRRRGRGQGTPRLLDILEGGAEAPVCSFIHEFGHLCTQADLICHWCTRDAIAECEAGNARTLVPPPNVLLPGMHGHPIREV